MCKRHKPCLVNCSQQETAGNTHRLINIIMFELLIPVHTITLLEHYYEKGCIFKERFLPTRSKGFQIGKPLIGRTMFVERFLFFLSRDPDLTLHFGVLHNHKCPRLLVGTGRSRRSCHNHIFDQFHGNFPG